jgi:hypothetical protein
MDVTALQAKATELESILVQYSPLNPEASALLRYLRPVFRLISWGQMDKPYEWSAIPGQYSFSSEGSLAAITELHRAYAAFAIELAGLADSPVIKDLKDRGPPC